MAKLMMRMGSVVMASLLMIGCGSGPKMATVSGTVTVDGQPTDGLEVEFLPKVGGTVASALGFTQNGGKYELHYPGGKKGAAVGEYKVRIRTAEGDGETPVAKVAAKYDGPSELTAKVEPGSNTLNFEVTSK